MINLFIDICRRIYKQLKRREFWVFYYLLLKFSRGKRYQPIYNKHIYGLNLDIADGPSFVYQFKEIFLDEIYRFAAPGDSPVIVDCGANIGISMLYFKKIYPKAIITGFEADKSIFKFLEKNLHLNCSNENINIINKAVWINNEGVCFASDGADGGSIKTTGEKVESIRLRTVLEGLEKVDMLKIDIEGAEAAVLEDCQDSLSGVENIFVEYHSFKNNEQSLSTILKIFEKNGFRYFIETLTRKHSPFLNHTDNQPMDLQLNIYGTRRPN